ncbi:MAG: DUF1564 family protein [Leptospiraceae bacterium]|nr:DUF1564 family protein [Leptospiraceae bacterium]
MLIPKHLLEYFTKRVRFFQGTRTYFEYLTVNYGRQLASYELKLTSSKWKQKYQDPGLDLQVRNFRPDPELWEEFRHIAFAYGLAMCHLFVVLLELEYSLWKQAGSPAIFSKIKPSGTAKHYPCVNSRHRLSIKDRKQLMNLLSSTKCTVLIRSIDLLSQKLHRVCLIN